MARPGEDRRGFLKQVAATSALLMSARGLSLAQVGEEDTPKWARGFWEAMRAGEP